jgi:hypothetical protein
LPQQRLDIAIADPFGSKKLHLLFPRRVFHFFLVKKAARNLKLLLVIIVSVVPWVRLFLSHALLLPLRDTGIGILGLIWVAHGWRWCVLG